MMFVVISDVESDDVKWTIVARSVLI